ncbi:hypothetical protein Klosneuvirus_3_205 [Klosneuvirus KNV1]|uniref:Uncharacterized protein n=1 Tax=Klosneuvirus KNV1 TaxID=1977640 RepID=A0A1V0SK15_9VIRU|nr:hypothetical protein Klosneuvirus_3_205 [Klosneuvirus KNV1]
MIETKLGPTVKGYQREIRSFGEIRKISFKHPFTITWLYFFLSLIRDRVTIEIWKQIDPRENGYQINHFTSIAGRCDSFKADLIAARY